MDGEVRAPRVECTIVTFVNRYIVNRLLDICVYSHRLGLPPTLAGEASFHRGQRSIQKLLTDQSANNNVSVSNWL